MKIRNLTPFPSPIGVLYILMEKEKKNEKENYKGFRPLSGFFIF